MMKILKRILEALKVVGVGLLLIGTVVVPAAVVAGLSVAPVLVLTSALQSTAWAALLLIPWVLSVSLIAWFLNSYNSW